MPKSVQNFASACTAGPGQRGVYAVVAIFMLAFGVGTLGENLVVGIGALLLSAGAVLMALTGLCWTDWLTLRSQPDQPVEVLGFPVVVDVITLDDFTSQRTTGAAR